MSVSYRLFGNRNLAAAWRGEAYRLLFLLRERLDLSQVDSDQLIRTYPDGTTIAVQSLFGNEIISIRSPFVSAHEEKEERWYYLRMGDLVSTLNPTHDYQFFKIPGSGLPPDTLQEIVVDGEDPEIFQAPYFDANTRTHKRDSEGTILLMPGLPNESFGGGTVDTPLALPSWAAFEDGDHFDRWDEYLTREASTYVEDDSGWSTDHGVYTYTRSRPYTQHYTDPGGAHSAASFCTDLREAIDDIQVEGDTFPAGSHADGTAQNIRRLRYVAGGEVGFAGEMMDAANPGIGNDQLKQIYSDITCTVDDSYSADWTENPPGGGGYDVSHAIGRTTSYTGPQKLLFGGTEVDSGAWDYTLTYSGSLTGYRADWQGLGMGLAREIPATDPTPFYCLSNEFRPTRFNFSNIGGDVITETTVTLGTQTVFSDLVFANVEDEYFGIFYKKATRVTDRSNTDGTVTGSEVTTYDYYLAFKTAVGLGRVTLAEYSRTITQGPFSDTIAGQKADYLGVHLARRFILYSYRLSTYAGGGAWTVDAYRYGVIDLPSGVRKEYSFTPAEWAGGPFDSPTILMYLPKNPENQP